MKSSPQSSSELNRYWSQSRSRKVVEIERTISAARRILATEPPLKGRKISLELTAILSDLMCISGSFLIGIAAFTVMSLCRSPAHGWGEKGHRTVAIVADMYLTEQSREQVRKLLPVGTTLADAAIWPDKEGRQVADLDRLHHVSIPDNASGYDQERDCSEIAWSRL